MSSELVVSRGFAAVMTKRLSVFKYVTTSTTEYCRAVGLSVVFLSGGFHPKGRRLKPGQPRRVTCLAGVRFLHVNAGGGVG